MVREVELARRELEFDSTEHSGFLIIERVGSSSPRQAGEEGWEKSEIPVDTRIFERLSTGKLSRG